MWMFLWTLKIKIMTKVIFTITAGLASLMGQLYESETKIATETKQQISSETVSDSSEIHLKQTIKKVLFPTKKIQQAS